jgi:hypothetical protein
MTEKDKNNVSSQPLDELLSLRGKPFADWKEERNYLRKKWGAQGRRVASGLPKNEDIKEDLAKEKEPE